MPTKWDNKPCPLCSEGTLRDGVRKKTLEREGLVYEYEVRGAFCDHCGDGFPSHDEQEEENWESFRDKTEKEAKR